MTSQPEFTDHFFDRHFATPGLINGVAVLGIFDRKFEEFGLPSSDQETHRITYRVKRTDAINAHHEDIVTVAGTEYSIVSIEPVYDGNTVVLVLN